MQVVYNDRHEGIQGKARHHCVEDPKAVIETRPVITPNGERHTCWERRSEQGGRIVHLNMDIGQGPRKDICVIISAADKHALQRFGVLGPWVCRAIYGGRFCTSPRFRIWEEITVRHSQVRPGRSRRPSASPQPPAEAKISERVRERSATVRLTSNGKGGAAMESKWRVSVFSCGILSSAPNQTASLGLALSEGVSISRYFRPFRSGEF